METALILVLFYLFAGGEPPGVNETHYLTKAKHYWNPTWCQGDMFLESADAHWLFYWTFGWVTRFLSLPATAWVGRFITWWGLAWSWQRLSWSLAPVRLWSVLSAALFLLFLDRFHMAGEWVVGDVEAKSFCYILIFLGLAALVKNQYAWVFPIFGAAAAFHVVAGGWAVIAAALAWCVQRGRADDVPTAKQLLWPVVLGGLLSLPGLLPCLLLNRGASADTVADGNLIYVYVRLNHHLVFHRLPWELVARHALLMASLGVALLVMRKQLLPGSLQWFLVGCAMIGLAGALIDQVLFDYPATWSAALLRFYWFRLSDAMLPVGLALLITRVVSGMTASATRDGLIIALSWVCLAFIGQIVYDRFEVSVPVAHEGLRTPIPGVTISPRKRHVDWVACCQWIRLQTTPHDLFLTPRAPQSFLWYAERPQVEAWKNAPQDAEGLVQWVKRYEDVENAFALHAPEVDEHLPAEERWKQLGAKYGAKYLVLDRLVSERPTSLVQVYPSHGEMNRSFAVYLLPLSPKNGGN